MKLIRIFLLIPMLTAALNLAFSQDQNINSSWSKNKPHPQEKSTYFERGPLFSAEDEAALKNAQESGNYLEAERIMKKMDEQVPEQYKFKTKTDIGEQPRPVVEKIIPFQKDWYTNDVQIWAGNVKYGDPYFRQIDMKMGEDGNIYVGFNRAPATGLNGRIDVYRSSNGGATWVYTNGLQYTTNYISSVSLLVEQNGSSVDSTRIFVFYTVSTSSNNDNSTLAFGSWRRDGNGWYAGNIATPPSGQEHSFPSAVSDGAFFNSGTWVGVFCTLSDNALTTTYDFRSYRSVNWGATWTGVTIATGNNDFYPSAELRPGSSSSTDSVWVAVERRFTSQSDIRIIRTPWTPTASSVVYFVTNSSSGQYYRKPGLTVKQNRACDSAMFTTTKNNIPYYCGTPNGGGSWFVDYTLGNGSNKAFTWSASGTGGPDPFMGMWVSNDGDSIGLRLGGRLGDLGTYVYKRNSNIASTSVSPTCIVYTPSVNVNRSAFSYAGLGPVNIYANQEDMQTGISKIESEVPENYSLSQNYPNPFNPTTTITFSIPKTGNVQLVVYDISGKEVSVIVGGVMNSGTYKVDFDASKLASGVYFYKLITDSFTDVKKMMLVR